MRRGRRLAGPGIGFGRLSGAGRLLAAVALLASRPAAAHPGGTPDFQTDVAPYCAACHSSRSAEALAGAGERATEFLVENRHIAEILAGRDGYASLTEPDRAALAQQIRALDAASTVALQAPETVEAGAVFEAEVEVTGGGGPVVGVGLVDRDHRWWARPAASAGWQVVSPPVVTGPDGALQTAWLARRPEAAGRNVSFVNVTDVASDPARERFARARVAFTLRAPDRPGSYPLAAVYLYGTEKSTVLGYTTDAQGHRRVRGGFDGGSGRVLFTPVRRIEVRAAEPAAASAGAPQR
jgi:mono/diheme cytochrome c family protein